MVGTGKVDIPLQLPPTAAPEAFRWTQSGGTAGLGDLPNGLYRSFGNGVSDDGTVVVGVGASTSGVNEAFRWTATGDMVGLGDLPGGAFGSEARDVSSDGSTVIGWGTVGPGGGDREAFRWTEAGGMVALGDLPGGNVFSQAWAVSADGTTVVGESSTLGGPQLLPVTEAFLWTENGGMVGLGDLPGGGFGSEAFDVNADGSVVVGMSRTGSIPLPPLGSAPVYEAFLVGQPGSDQR